MLAEGGFARALLFLARCQVCYECTHLTPFGMFRTRDAAINLILSYSWGEQCKMPANVAVLASFK